MNNVQVKEGHYEFDTYMHFERWSSIWQQMQLVTESGATSILEIGAGSGVFSSTCKAFGLSVDTFDFDENVSPTYLGSIIDDSLPDTIYDVVCAFQVLEHLEYKHFIPSIKKMLAQAKYSVIISVPNSILAYRYSLKFPFVKQIDLLIENPFHVPREHHFDGEHFWELGKKNYPVERIRSDLGDLGVKVSDFRYKRNPYHHFFMLEG